MEVNKNVRSKKKRLEVNKKLEVKKRLEVNKKEVKKKRMEVNKKVGSEK